MKKTTRAKKKTYQYVVILDKYYMSGPLKNHWIYTATYKFNDKDKATIFINKMKEAERTVSITSTELDYSQYTFVPDRVHGESR